MSKRQRHRRCAKYFFLRTPENLTSTSHPNQPDNAAVSYSSRCSRIAPNDFMIPATLLGGRQVLSSWTGSWQTCDVCGIQYAIINHVSDPRTFKTTTSEEACLTSSKSSYLSRQFSQYPGLGSLFAVFLFLDTCIARSAAMSSS